MFICFRVISLFILLSATVAQGAVSEIDGPDDVFGGGGGGCTTDCTFDNINTGTLTAGKGVFTTISSVLSGTSSNLNLSTGGVLTMKGTSIGMVNTPGGWASVLNSTALGLYGNRALGISPNNSTPDVFITRTADAGLRLSTFTDIAGGIKSALRNLSSVSETLTVLDHDVFCLANDNAVTINLPPVSSTLSSNLRIKYIDTGSSNKCFLEGDGAETIDGFTNYSGLDTYRECVSLGSDGSNWWIMGGCP